MNAAGFSVYSAFSGHVVAANAPPSAAQLADPAIARTWKAAQDFEAMALGQLLAPMFDTVDNAHSLFGGGDGEATWRPMMTQEIAKSMAAHGGLGLAVPVFRQMLQMQEARTPHPHTENAP